MAIKNFFREKRKSARLKINKNNVNILGCYYVRHQLNSFSGEKNNI